MLNKCWKSLLAAALTLALLTTGAALAGEYGYEIDVAAMKALEEGCPFPVRVTEKKVVEECFDTEGFFDDNDDALVITVTNGSDAEITALKVCFVGYDADQLTRRVQGDDMSIASFNASPKINTLSKDGLSVAPGGSCALSMKVDYAHDGTSKFVGIRAMVESYTTADGAVVANPQYDEWQNLAFGMAGGNVTELD